MDPTSFEAIEFETSSGYLTKELRPNELRYDEVGAVERGQVERLKQKSLLYGAF